jgi:hypothetical protein
LDFEGLKILNNVKIRWISMLSPLKRVLSLDEHRLVVKKMALEKVEMPSTTANFERLVDVEVFLGLSGMLPLLEAVHTSSKCVHARDCYNIDFITAISHCQGDLHKMYVDMHTMYEGQEFERFIMLV